MWWILIAFLTYDVCRGCGKATATSALLFSIYVIITGFVTAVPGLLLIMFTIGILKAIGGSVYLPLPFTNFVLISTPKQSRLQLPESK